MPHPNALSERLNIGTDLHEAISIRAGKRAWWVEPAPDGYAERAIEPRLV